MKMKTATIALLSAFLLTSACKSPYRVTSIERSRILIDSRYDVNPDVQAATFLQPYKQKVDSVMSPVVGRSAKYMTVQRPESELSNLLCDIMVWSGKLYNEKVDFGIYNMGGIRANLAKGDITYGAVLDIAPFENKMAFGTLKGSEVLELFQQIGRMGGEGVSHEVRLVYHHDGQLKSATIHGVAVDPDRDYRLATTDYLMGGTDNMEALKKCRQVNSPQDFKNNTRFIIMDYCRELMNQGKEVDAQIEGRIVIVQ